MAYFDDETVDPLRGQKRRQQGMPGQAPQPAPPAAYSTTQTQQPQTQVPTSPDFGAPSPQRDPMQTTPTKTAPAPTPADAAGVASAVFGGVQDERTRLKALEPPTRDATPHEAPTASQGASAPIGPPSSYAARYPMIVQAYQQYLGRVPSDAEIRSHSGNGSFDPTDQRIWLSVGNIANSPEANRYKQNAAPAQQTPDTEASPDRWANAPADGNWRSWFTSNVASLPPTPQSLIALEGQLSKHGITVLRNAEGVAGKIRLPNGEIVDVIQAAGAGGRAWQWLTGGEGGRNGGEPAPTSTGTLGSWSSAMSAGGLTAFQEQVRQMILQQLAGAAQPVDPNSPEIRLPIGEAERRAEQIRRRRQSADAERLTQSGIGDSGALDTARRQGFEDMSQTISGVTAQIISEQMQNKRRELVTLLTTAMASGDADAARQVQMQLAAIDAELRQFGLNQQNAQYYAGLGQQQGQFNDQLDLDWARFDTNLLG